MRRLNPYFFILCLILILFLSVKAFHLFKQTGVGWDAAVYVGMGRYIFSYGTAGLFEPVRPLMLPLILGFFWKIGLNPLFFGEVAEILFALGCICMTFIIGKEVFKEKVALVSAFFVAFNSTFLFYSSTQMTEIPALFFSLLAVYFFLRKKYFLAGLFVGISFMTRFLQLFVIMPLFFIIVLYDNRKKGVINLFNLLCGFSVPVVPYLAINLVLYKNPIYPFLSQVFMTRYTGWVFHQPLSFYMIHLLKENFLVVFAIIGIVLILIRREKKKMTVAAVFLVFFIFFNAVVHKEMRFVITFLPYMYLIASYGLLKSALFIRNRKVLLVFVSVLCLIWLFQTVRSIDLPSYREYPIFKEYLEQDDVAEGIWLSNPVFIVYSDKKADELVYYPLYNSEKIDLLRARLPEARHILIDTCDILPCPPQDSLCYNKTSGLLDSFGKDFDLVYSREEAGCRQLIFKRKFIAPII